MDSVDCLWLFENAQTLCGLFISTVSLTTYLMFICGENKRQRRHVGATSVKESERVQSVKAAHLSPAVNENIQQRSIVGPPQNNNMMVPQSACAAPSMRTSSVPYQSPNPLMPSANEVFGYTAEEPTQRNVLQPLPIKRHDRESSLRLDRTQSDRSLKSAYSDRKHTREDRTQEMSQSSKKHVKSSSGRNRNKSSSKSSKNDRNSRRAKRSIYENTTQNDDENNQRSSRGASSKEKVKPSLLESPQTATTKSSKQTVNKDMRKKLKGRLNDKSIYSNSTTADETIQSVKNERSVKKTKAKSAHSTSTREGSSRSKKSKKESSKKKKKKSAPNPLLQSPKEKKFGTSGKSNRLTQAPKNFDNK